MRKIFKLLMSVVAMSAVVSCTTDATEDLSVKVGGKTQLTLSLDGTRTQLGTKDEVKNIYPLLWSEDDQISVNGTTSDKLTVADGAGTSSAVFTFGGELETPYFVAYPATEVANQVVFAAEQYYNNNTSFESGVAAMYGRSEDGKSVKLNHLTGILKIGIKGEAKLLQARISTIDRKPIAGTFNAEYDTEKGEYAFTPAETSEVITYYFGMYDEALDLSKQDGTTYIYVAVPTINGGVYNELYVTLTDNEDGVMYTTIKANTDKPLKAGAVREFKSDITYKAIDTEELFVIDSYSALDSFKQKVENGSNINAVIINDIDVEIPSVTEGGWKPINAPNYTGEFNGNGYALIGIDAPLFDTVAATIKGVHLRDVKITNESNPNIGALVRFLDATNNANATVSNCSAEGSISVKSDGSMKAEQFYTAGLVGYTNSTQTFSNLRSAVDITVEGTINGKYSVCGVVCTTAGTLENVTNLGVITYNASATGTIYLAGVCYDGTIFNNCNNGDGTVKAGTTTKRGSILLKSYVTTTPCLSGVAGEISGMSNCHNYGDITLDSNINGNANIYIGGVVRQVNVDNCLMENCSNRGNISVLKKITAVNNRSLLIGGIMCWHAPKKNTTIKGCINYGTISLGENFEANNIGTMIGGIISQLPTSDSYSIICTNCSNEGDFYAKKGSKTMMLAIGGLMGYAVSAGCWLTVDTFTNNGDMYIDCTTNTAASNTLALGGVIGWWTNGNPSVNSKGYMKNTGDINFGGTVESGRLTVGGYIGGTNKKNVFQDDIYVVCTGNITCTGTINESAANKIGGVIGTDVGTPILNAQCYCTIKAYDRTNKKSYGDCVGLLCGTTRSSSIYSKNCSVGGNICRGLDADGNEIIEGVNASTALTTLYPTAIDEDALTAEGLTFLSSANEILYNLQ